MALTENTSNAGVSQPKATSNNLLDFINGASSSIQDAMVSKKKRTVNVRKYIQKRVKRLNDHQGPKSTKNKSVLRKPGSAKQLQCLGSMSWPLLATPSDYSAQTQGLETSNYPTVCSPPSSGSYAAGNEIETSLYRTSASNNKVIDAELDTLLSELAGLDSQPSTRHSSDSFQTGASPSYTPQSTLESQVYLAEHPYSPLNSDCSDDVYEDSAYSSPVGSVDYRSVACSPHMPASDWSVQNSAPAPTICPVTSTAWFSEQQAVSGSGWLPHFSSYEQGPPMTPTVSELLLDRASYF